MMGSPRKNWMTVADVVYYSWRDLGILLARTRGDTLRKIGEFYGLSAETVRLKLLLARRRLHKQQDVT